MTTNIKQEIQYSIIRNIQNVCHRLRMNWYTLVWHDICLGHIELHVALEICRLKKLDKDLEKAVKYAWKNCVAFGLNVISGTWSKGYTDSFINVLNILRLHQTKDYKIGISICTCTQMRVTSSKCTKIL